MAEIMKAATLTVRGTEQGRPKMRPVSFDGDILSSRLGICLSEKRCPSCNSLVYTRRHSRCGVCEQVLPESFRFTGAEAEKIDILLRTERKRHRAWLTKVEVGPL